MSGPVRHVVVIGASAAGVTVADTLRDHGFAGRITQVGKEPHPPYDRPPLSKEVLAGTRAAATTALRPSKHYEDHGIDLRTGQAAVRLAPTAHEVQLDSGETLRYDALVAATGVAPRRLAHGQEVAGVHVLRTLDDLVAFRADVLAARRIVVVGAGFLGMEVAATCRRLGVGVTVVSTRPGPLLSQVGPMVSGQVAALHAEHGVVLRTGVGVADIRETGGRVTGVVLTDHSVVAADAVLVAIGSEPQTGWLGGSGLDTSDGVGCDSHGRAAPDVYAAGDVTRWRPAGADAPLHVEHRMNATEQGMTVARNILGANERFPSTPYAWSDQYEARIQIFGFIGARHDVAIVEGSLEDRRFVALYGLHGRVTGVLAWRLPKGLHRARDIVARAAAWSEVRNGDQAASHAATHETPSAASATPIPADSRGALR